jgi:ABC-type antimicrobial peptide transport system permease subunit
MFGMHTLFIAILTIILFAFGYNILAVSANDILLDSLRNIGHVKFLGDIEIITFEWIYVVINSITVLLMTLISTIIPVLLLKRIKPIKIINSRE